MNLYEEIKRNAVPDEEVYADEGFREGMKMADDATNLEDKLKGLISARVAERIGYEITENTVDYISRCVHDYDLTTEEQNQVSTTHLNELVRDTINDHGMRIEESDNYTVEEFDKELVNRGINTVSPLYYVTGAPNCHSIEQADAHYNSLPSYSSVNYIKDKGDLTDEQFRFIDEHRDLAKQIINGFVNKMLNSGPLD